MRVVVAADAPHRERMAEELGREGFDVVAVPADEPAASSDAALYGDRAVESVLSGADVLVLAVTRTSLTAGLLAACDRLGVRVVPLAASPDAEQAAAAAGLPDPLALDAPGWLIADAATGTDGPGSVSPVAASRGEPSRGVVVAVWGAAGSPGRSTMAIAVAAELARDGRRVALVDADTHAPSLALALGLADEGPGFASACRQADRAALDAAELTRIAEPLTLEGVRLDVLTGINRPSRWPELTEQRVAAALDACREWADCTVVDVASSLERDEEIVSDLVDGPRRNAATLAALRSADVVIAVLSADPLGAARFVRAYPELRSTIGATPVVVVANRLRPGALGIDSRGQVRRTLDRFAGIRDVAFVPLDPRPADAAMLTARPIAEVAPRSPFTLAVRRLVGDALVPALGGGAAEASVVRLPERAPRRRPRASREARTA